ncbi:MAG: outer membrane protein assembly factor BamE [Maricaulaceae bacterium]|jgi:outer membrane protein assembly factor BamE (lipoprotein component of BamABCDE complex)
MKYGRHAAAALLLAAAAASACTPVVRRHGYVPESVPLSDIQPQVDNQTTVFDRYGSPSTTGTFDGSTWYYITNVREQLGYLRPESTARLITEVSFDETGVVASVETYDLDDARTVNLINRTTPTRGREITILEQLLGNVGSLPTDQITNQDNLPGGAGGPRRE